MQSFPVHHTCLQLVCVCVYIYIYKVGSTDWKIQEWYGKKIPKYHP